MPSFNVAQSAEARQDVKAVQTASAYAIEAYPDSFPQVNFAEKLARCQETIYERRLNVRYFHFSIGMDTSSPPG
ncbi:hypothetical protein ACFQ2B_25775 [Streptomyces stramineus]